MFVRSLFTILFVSVVAMAGTAHTMPLAPATPPSLVEQASFWAQPYPYGYRWRKTPCTRWVPSCRVSDAPVCEVRWQRVWVCR